MQVLCRGVLKRLHITEKDVDYDDPATEEEWCKARRSQVAEHLDRQGIVRGEVGEWPAWHIAPYVSIWAVESGRHPGSVGWWAICGDLPTDYISAEKVKHPRQALRTIARNWNRLSSLMAHGKSHPTMAIGSPEDWPTLAPLLRSRAKILREWALDDELWQDCDSEGEISP